MRQPKESVKRVISTLRTADNNPLREYMLAGRNEQYVLVGYGKAEPFLGDGEWDIMVIRDEGFDDYYQLPKRTPANTSRWYWLAHDNDCVADQRADLKKFFGKDCAASPVLFNHGNDTYNSYHKHVKDMLTAASKEVYEAALTAFDANLLKPGIEERISKFLWSGFAAKVNYVGEGLLAACSEQYSVARKELIEELKYRNVAVPDALKNADDAASLTDDEFRALKATLFAIRSSGS